MFRPVWEGIAPCGMDVVLQQRVTRRPAAMGIVRVWRCAGSAHRNSAAGSSIELMEGIKTINGLLVNQRRAARSYQYPAIPPVMEAQMKTETTSNMITFTFDGDLAPVVFSATDAERHLQRAAMHGFEQKIRDNAAIARKQKDGSIITVTEAMRHVAVTEMVTHLTTSADWNMRGVGRSAAQNPIWLQIATKRGVEYSVIAAEMAQRDLDALMAA